MRSMAIITCGKYFLIDVKLAGEIFIPPNLHLLILIAFVELHYEAWGASGNYEARGAKWRGITKLE